MLTAYNSTHDKAIAGQPIGDWRDSRPMSLPWLAQSTRIRIADASANAGEAITITVTDDESDIVHTLSALTGANLGATLDNILAAFLAHASLPTLFTAVEDGSEDFEITARHANRTYTVAASVATGSMTFAVSSLQAAGGDGLVFGIMVAKASTGDKDCRALEATDTITALCGILFRTDANHFHSLENDGPSAVDRCQRGKTLSIMEEGRVWVTAEDAVAPGEPVYVRRAQTSSVGTVGGFRSSPAGSAQVTTVAPVADQVQWAFTLTVKHQTTMEPRTFLAQYQATDGTTTVADAIDGLFDNIVQQLGAADSATNGYGVTITESDTLLTITTDAGVEIVGAANAFWSLDAEAATSVVSVGAADVDTIDVSKFCRWESTAAAGALAELRIKM